MAAIELVSQVSSHPACTKVKSRKVGEITEVLFYLANGYVQVFGLHDRELNLPDNGKFEAIRQSLSRQGVVFTDET